MTQYLGEILTPRAGLSTPAEFRDNLALIAASLDRKAGRKWRPLEDTAVAALRFKNGALGTIEAATSAFPGLTGIAITLSVYLIEAKRTFASC